MATARAFSVLYALVAKICQDQSTDGLLNAKSGINTVIKELTREFKLPSIFKGQDNSVYVTPTQAVGPQLITLASDIVRLSNVFWIDNSRQIFQLTEIESDDEWLQAIDMNRDGDPSIYRDFQTNSAGVPQIQIWPGPSSSWVSRSSQRIYYTYWAQLAQLSADGDVPAIPYELDPILVNGGIVEMARMQGDTTLIGLYEKKYEDDKGELRKWIIKQHERDIQMEPDQPQGVFGQDYGTGYKIAG